MKEWIPILQQLIWPVFIIVLLFVFKDKVNGLYNMATEGREIEIAGILKIGQKIKETEIRQFASSDMSVEGLEGDEVTVSKGGMDMLGQLQERLRNSELKSIDVMVLDDYKYYVRDMLLQYTGTLGIKQIVFLRDGEFDGWIDGSLFSGQLFATPQQGFEYKELKNFLAGIRYETVNPEEKTITVLEKMRDLHLDKIPVVEDRQYKYFVYKADILTTLVSGALTENPEQQ